MLILAAERCYYRIREAVLARISHKSSTAAAEPGIPVGLLSRTPRRTGERVCGAAGCSHCVHADLRRCATNSVSNTGSGQKKDR
jgi:hypothetical protein